MPFNPPALDDRRFNDLVGELIARIPAHTPEWTNPRQGDPGRTIIELFAWLADALLYRINLIPERQRLAFLRLLGVQMRPATPARGIVTIGFSDADTIAAQVVQPLATVKGPLNFETISEITVLPIAGEAYYKRQLNDVETAAIHDLLPGLVQLYGIDGKPKPYATTPVFPGGAPDPNGFDLMKSADGSLWIALTAPKEKVVAVRKAIASQAISIGVTPAIDVPGMFEEIGPRGAIPHTWQITTGSMTADVPRLVALDVLADSTGGLRQQGVERLLLPREELIGAPNNDVRKNLRAGMGAGEPPRVDDADKAASIVTWLRLMPTAKVESLVVSWTGVNAVTIEQLQTMSARIVGQGDGTANQEFTLPAQSIERASFALQVEETGHGFVPWTQVEDLGAVGRDARAFTLDAEAGAVRFGDGVRGKIPETQLRIRVATMRAGGGAAGNLPAGSLAEVTGLDADGALITPVSKLKVVQTQATLGGDDAETLAAAEQRVPALFRNRDRAVTSDDYKRLAFETPGVQLGRVELMPRFKPQQRRSDVPGVVSVMVLPFKGPVGPPNPRPDRPTLETVYARLADRKPIATELYVVGCEYVPISISIGVALLDGTSRETALARIRDAARQFMWPLPGGGTDGGGWRLGRSVRDRELDVMVARVPGVDEINGVNLFIKSDNRWQFVPPQSATGLAEVALEPWQLPELLHVVVVTDANPPTSLDGIDDGADDAVAVPVVPEVC